MAEKKIGLSKAVSQAKCKEYTIKKEVKNGHKVGAKVKLAEGTAKMFKSKGII